MVTKSLIPDPHKTRKITDIAKDTIKLFEDPIKLMNDEHPLDRKAVTLLIGELTRRLLNEVLNDHPLKFTTNKELYNHVYNDYKEVKKDIETVMGLAFTFSIKKLSGKNLDYLCEIKPVPEKSGNGEN
jgi:hypothetical protein